MKAAILGAGICGLSVAILLKLKGIEVEILEKEKCRTDIGAGIVCWPNACFVLQELGVLEQVKQKSGQPQKMQRFSDLGESLGSLDIQKLNALLGYQSYSILRKDLMQILESRAIKLGISIRYDNRVTNLETTCGQAKVRLQNGDVVSADLIIGADGRMRSLARAYVNQNNKPVYQQFINWVGVTESEQEIFDETAVQDFWGVGERFGIVPVSPKKAYWAGAIRATEIGSKDPKKYKKELFSLFQDWPQPISSVIAQCPESDINKIYVHDHNPLKSWHKNNVLVLGDAAHAPLPTSGQGACQALEDAWHLADILKDNKTNLELACKNFTSRRLAKTSGIIWGGRQLARSIFSQDPEFCRQRNINSIETDYDQVVTSMAKGWASGLPIAAS
ncbi:MAG: FAD-dependent monooxygenase [Kangiellaceae bacterium]|nr:FAD-dependent monooxygenase [Kangiellaceae bacterium]MCW8998560.1 FAD-dependent monooxygenase [Kangiellaceae bacterium]MCW9017689.1 FAD-dependent monooxygenase [Kangiellaceae bacterium]